MRSGILWFRMVTQLLASTALAASAPSLAPGTRVRLTVPTLDPPRQTATWVGSTSDSLVIRPDHRDTTVTIARVQLTNLEISQGIRRHGLKGLGMGLLIGAGVGAGIGSLGDAGLAGKSTSVLAGAVLLGGVGMVVGGGVGVFDRSESWSRTKTSQ